MQKKIALVNDITGFGRCSIAVMAPIVSAMKIQAVSIPTAILSAHTQFPEYYFDDYTDKMTAYIDTYKTLGLEFDGIATGFLGSASQVDIVTDFIKHFKKDKTFVLIDPVMGDYGKLYKTYTPQMCHKMKELVKFADLITPNLTELTTLLDLPYPDHQITFQELEEMCSFLAEKGPKNIVVTGIDIDGKQIVNYIYNVDSESQVILADRIGGDRSGTGDVISAVLAGMCMNGHSIYDATKKASEFVSKCISYCEEHQVPNHYGLSFEMYLNELCEE